MARYEYLQHLTSGEIYPVELDRAERVVRSLGPINQGNLLTNPAGFAVNMTDEDNEWFAEHEAEFRLLSRAEVMQLQARVYEQR